MNNNKYNLKSKLIIHFMTYDYNMLVKFFTFLLLEKVSNNKIKNNLF